MASRLEPLKRFLWRDDGSHLPIGIGCPIPPLTEIVRILDGIKRWNGHNASAISVCEHSVRVAQVVGAEQAAMSDDEQCSIRQLKLLVRASLLHDSSEALYGDRSTPIKQIERHMLDELGKALGVEIPHPNDLLVDDFEKRIELEHGLPPGSLNWPEVKRADQIACVIEMIQRGIPLSEAVEWFGPGITVASVPLELFGRLESPQRSWWVLWNANQ